MTYQEAFEQAIGSLPLSVRGGDSCLFDLSLLFERAFGQSRYRLPLIGQEHADETACTAFFRLCTHYADGEPLQYLLGEWEFYGLPFEVGEGVLIPRPDTETLVETALELLRGVTSPVVADLCAGSGCVAAAIAHMRPDARVLALELSDAAFPYLARNLARNGGRVEALHCNVLEPPALPLLDLVVSNPPYIPAAEMETLQLQVRHEPEMALYGGTDGYDFYRALPVLYRPLLRDGGSIAFEVGYNQAEQVSALLAEAGYQCPQIRNDLAGIARVVFAAK